MNWQAVAAILAAVGIPLGLMQFLMKKPPRKKIRSAYDQWLEDEQTAWPRRMFWRGMAGFALVLVIGLPLAGLWILAFGS